MPKGRSLARLALIALGLLIVAAGVAGLGLSRFAGHLRDARNPEATSARREVQARQFTGAAVVSAHPEASEAGRHVLAVGGSALDAAVAVQATLGLVEPQASGVGGGAFLLYWDALRQTLRAYDGRERAPMAADAAYLLDADGEPRHFLQAFPGGLAVGVPGVMRMLQRAHRDHGRLPWSRLFERATQLANDGFRLSPRLARQVAVDPILPSMPAMRAVYLAPDGRGWPAGHTLTNPAYARTLGALAAGGAEALYHGPIAEHIVAAVQGAKRPSVPHILFNAMRLGLGLPALAGNTRGTGGGDASTPAPGSLQLRDLADYRSQERAPLCRTYRQRYRVCVLGAPSGGLSVLQILGLLERFELASLDPNSSEAMHLMGEAMRLAYADRDRWVADPDAVRVPAKGLLDANYLEARGASIAADLRMPNVSAGQPAGADARFGSAQSPEQPCTSHFSIVDADGSIVSMTTSIEMAFGSHLMVDGFMLNNQLTDFAFAPRRPASDEARAGGDEVEGEGDGDAMHGPTVANAPGPGKRPRSAMSPLIIFEGDQPRFAIGSPGGPSIIAYVVRAATALMDWQLPPQQAVGLPHIATDGDLLQVERSGWESEATRDRVVTELEALGHEVELADKSSGLHVLELRGTRVRAGVDPRREGEALGRK